ncbi:MAG: RDD family protein [Flavobacterium sp.]|uniref:RDD family protein n=1 Tax=Flavobacterium sp. TaxID=239 RepID=UPI0032642DE7
MEHTKTKPHTAARFLAGFIDYAIIFAVTVYLIVLIGKKKADGEYEIAGLTLLIPMLFWAFMTIGLEQLFGVTLGNGIVGLKPVQENLPGKISLEQSFKRHLMDPVDMFFFGLVGFITISKTPKNQRVGDLWAETIVVDANQIFTEE